MSFFDFIGPIYRKEYAAIEGLLTPEGARELDEDGRTLLMHAVLDDTAAPRMVGLLVRHGMPIDAADNGER